MGQISVEITRLPGSLLSGNQQSNFRVEPEPSLRSLYAAAAKTNPLLVA